MIYSLLLNRLQIGEPIRASLPGAMSGVASKINLRVADLNIADKLSMALSFVRKKTFVKSNELPAIELRNAVERTNTALFLSIRAVFYAFRRKPIERCTALE